MGDSAVRSGMTGRLLALCFDSNDPLRHARFWHGILGWELTDGTNDRVELLPSDGTGFGFRFLPSRIRKSSLNDRHLHLTSTSLENQHRTVARALELGAQHIDVGQRAEEGHIVLADPEGNEFCVIEPGNNYLAGCGFLGEVTCVGSRQVGYFWSQALNWPLVLDQGLQTAIQQTTGGPKISWDEEWIVPKGAENRLHFEVATAIHGDQRKEANRLVSLGATVIDMGQGDLGRMVMADPDGRKFFLQTLP
jgi:hypothetical protein